MNYITSSKSLESSMKYTDLVNAISNKSGVKQYKSIIKFFVNQSRYDIRQISVQDKKRLVSLYEKGENFLRANQNIRIYKGNFLQKIKAIFSYLCEKGIFSVWWKVKYVKVASQNVFDTNSASYRFYKKLKEDSLNIVHDRVEETSSEYQQYINSGNIVGNEDVEQKR